ncbi:hypothetical protein Hanom_Chr16g01510651 [Helianthus anomalus]
MKKFPHALYAKPNFIAYKIWKKDAESSDKKIYSQTIHNNCPLMDVYIIPHGESAIHQNMLFFVLLLLWLTVGLY